MTTVLTLEKPRQVQEKPVPQGPKEITWGYVMRELGYPESWGEFVAKRLAAQGKIVQWRKVSDQ